MFSQIVASARAFFNTYKTRDVSFRRQQLKNLLKMLEENKTKILDALMVDLHKVHTPRSRLCRKCAHMLIGCCPTIEGQPAQPAVIMVHRS
jgi:acyl-CoA reductase-like NAD-dependent aldehyde dehydrogenase